MNATDQSVAPLFDFDLRLTQEDKSGYYYARWDRAQRMTVRAATEQQAVAKAAAALGPAARGWRWVAKTDAIRESLAS